MEKILAVATSAVREARNGEDFLERIGRKLGIWPRAISGEEEARLIYLAALHSIHLEGRRALVVDIGGGSVELASGRGEDVEAVLSEKLGVLRMTERFVKSDPIAPHDEKRLVQHVEKTLEPGLRRLRRKASRSWSGRRARSWPWAASPCERRPGSGPSPCTTSRWRAEAIHAVRRLARVQLDLRARLKLPGLDERRADIIVAGAVLLDTLLQQPRLRRRSSSASGRCARGSCSTTSTATRARWPGRRPTPTCGAAAW